MRLILRIITTFAIVVVGLGTLSGCQHSSEKLPVYINATEFARGTEENRTRFQTLSDGGHLPRKLSSEGVEAMAKTMSRAALVGDAYDRGEIDQATLERERAGLEVTIKKVLGVTLDEFAEATFR